MAPGGARPMDGTKAGRLLGGRVRLMVRAGRPMGGSARMMVTDGAGRGRKTVLNSC